MQHPYDALDAAALTNALTDTPISLFLYDTIDSTNSEAKRYAQSGGAAPALFVAEEQSGGRGRMGRSFFSPSHTGIYLSLLLRSDAALSDPITATSAAAVAVLLAIREITGLSVGIKWVNDLYYEEKKVCGILAESFFLGEERYLIIGVGVNLYTEDFPDELTATAGALRPEDPHLRTALTAEITRRLYRLLQENEPTDFMALYRANSIVLGRPITYTQNQRTKQGVAEKIDELGHLIVRHDDGTTATLASGEISLRLTQKGTKQ